MTAREQGIEELALPDMERRVANTVRFGTVSAIDHAKRRVRVKSGEIETAWLPWSAGRAAEGKRRWDAPEVGEQVIVLAPTGDLRQAGVIPGFYQDTYDAPSSDPAKDKAEYSDGAVIEYDRGAHALTADLQGAKIFADRSKIELTIGGTVLTLTSGQTTLQTPKFVVDSPESIFTGKVTVQGLLTYLAGLIGYGGAGGGGAILNGPLTVNGNVATNGTLVNNGTNVGSTHTHSGVQPGGANTGTPS